MKYLFLFLSIALMPFASSAQNSDCSCADDLEFVTNYYERNLPGFADNVSDENRNEYDAFKEKLKGEAAKSSNRQSCFKVLTAFVEFFKDNHSRIIMSSPNVDESDAAKVDSFLNHAIYQQRERLLVDGKTIEQFPLDNIRGVYQTDDTAYTIAVVPDRTPLRDYVGIIVESKTPLWTKGQVKLELKANADGSWQVFSYLRNHSLSYTPAAELVGGVLDDTWFKTSLANTNNPIVNHGSELESRWLNDSTYYLRIPTFSGSWSARIRKFYKNNEKTVRSAPYLVVDVRNNGGGSDDNAYPLLKYFYSEPIQGDTVELYCTADNLKIWESWTADAKQDKKNYSKADVMWFQRQVNLMKKAEEGSFVLRSSGGKLKIKKTGPQPKKVAIIQNKYCASSCETLLFWSQQSERSITVGENSGGYVGYGEVGNVRTPCHNFTLYCTMTRYNYQRQFEVVGIAPDYYLSREKDWIKQAAELVVK